MNREPLVSTTSIGAAVAAVLVLLVSFGLDISDDQQAAILGVVAIAAPLVGLFARGRVTPVSDPKDSAGTPLVPDPSAVPPFFPTDDA